MPMETLIQSSLNLVKSYQQRFWAIASKHPNSPEKQGIYSDPSYANLNPDFFHWINPVSWMGGKNTPGVFYSHFQSERGERASHSY